MSDELYKEQIRKHQRDALSAKDQKEYNDAERGIKRLRDASDSRQNPSKKDK